jgi:hypothetical protein
MELKYSTYSVVLWKINGKRAWAFIPVVIFDIGMLITNFY